MPALNLTVRVRSTKRGSRCLSVNRTVWSSIFSADFRKLAISVAKNRSCLPSPFWRSISKVYTTSSAVNGALSDHVTPSRSFTVTCVKSAL